MKPLAIIGLDPGTTAGYVVLGLDGRVLTSAAAKNLPLAAIITAVMDVGQPIVVSTDKARVPSLVEEFSRKVGAEIVSPQQDLTREEKRQLLQEHNYYYKSHHQQDSLAAALFAYKRYRPRLEKINRYVAENILNTQDQQSLHGHEQEFTKIALKEDLHFALIKELVTGIGKEPALVPVIRSVIQENKITKKDFLALYQRWARLKQDNEALEKELGELQTFITQLQQQQTITKTRARNLPQKIKTLFQFKENRLHQLQRQIRQQQGITAQLRQEQEQLYRFITTAPHGQLIKKLDTLSQAEFERKKSILGLGEEDVLFVHNTGIYSLQVVEALKNKNILLLSPRKVSSPIRQALAGGEFSGPFREENEYFALVDPEVLQNYRQRPKIDSIVQEYRLSRKSTS